MLARSAAVMLVIAVLLCSAASWAGPETPDLEKVIKSLTGIPVADNARYHQDADRYLRFIGAPPGMSFRASSAKSADPEQATQAFLLENAKAFGAGGGRQAFKRLRVTQDGDSSFVRLQQTYDGIPVFGAEVNAQVGPDGGIRSLLSDIMRDTRLLDQKTVSTTPTVGKDAARQRALLHVRGLFPIPALEVLGEPVLQIYHP
ncbi:MAG: hypothetical protein RBU21_04185, partial [FCB group bacterium]|nr:hypothetical protein [FCB group bacterium]